MNDKKIPIEVSVRHLHVSKEDLEKLFGPEYALNVQRKISQPGQFAAQESVKIIGPKGILPTVRIIGPVREQTQLELSITDGFLLGIHPTVKVSGELEGSVGDVTLVGPGGSIEMKQGVIVAQRHLHLSPTQAAKFGLKHLDIVSVKVSGQRALVFNNVVVRSREGVDELSFMIDTDEANAAGVRQGEFGELIIS
jgi:putative phosphotransacetylase